MKLCKASGCGKYARVDKDYCFGHAHLEKESGQKKTSKKKL